MACALFILSLKPAVAGITPLTTVNVLRCWRGLQQHAVQAGLTPRQRVFAISDPVRRGEMLQLNDRPSLRFVRDALQMQRGEQMELVLSKEPLAQEEDPQEAWAPPAESKSEAARSS